MFLASFEDFIWEGLAGTREVVVLDITLLAVSCMGPALQRTGVQGRVVAKAQTFS